MVCEFQLQISGETAGSIGSLDEELRFHLFRVVGMETMSWEGSHGLWSGLRQAFWVGGEWRGGEENDLLVAVSTYPSKLGEMFDAGKE